MTQLSPHNAPPPLRYGSDCSGIEAVSLAWQPLGMQPAWFSEIESFPSAVLAHHHPSVPNLGDMTGIAGQVRRGTVEAPDILVGGTPCQSFSIAGARQGMTDRAEHSPLATWTSPMPSTKLVSKPVARPRSSSGKTSLACSRIVPTPLAACLAHWLGKNTHCSLQGQSGRTLVLCMDQSASSSGGSWTLNYVELHIKQRFFWLAIAATDA